MNHANHMIHPTLDVEDIESRPAVVIDKPSAADPATPEMSERDRSISAMFVGPFQSPLVERLCGVVPAVTFAPVFIAWTAGANYAAGVVKSLPSVFHRTVNGEDQPNVQVQLVSDVLVASPLAGPNGEPAGIKEFASHLCAVVDNGILNGFLPVVDTQVLPSVATFTQFLSASLVSCGFTLIILCRETDISSLEPYARSLLEATSEMKRPVTIRALFVKDIDPNTTIVMEANALGRVLLDTFSKEFGLTAPEPT